MSLSPAAGPWPVLADPNFRRYVLGRICSWASLQIVGVAVGWQVYELTHSTFALGMVGLVQYLPMVLLALLVGHAADRFRRRTIVTLCQLTYALACAALAWASYANRLNETGIFCLLALVGTARAFEVPAAQALVPRLVEARDTASAMTFYSSSYQLSSILGPALGGFLYVLGAQVPYALAAGICLLAAGLTLSVEPRRTPTPGAETEGSIFSGIHFVWTNQKILGATSLDLFVVMLGGATALMPAFARDLLHTGPWGLGLLRLAPAVGAVLTSAFFAHRIMRRNVGLRMFLATILFGMATVGFALSRSLWLSIVFLAILGGADIVSVVIRGALVQLETPDAMRGRVSAISSLFVGTSNELGEFESGVTAACFGLVPATVIGGLGSVAISLLWMRWFPSLRRLERLEGK